MLDMEKMEDASTELMMGEGGSVRILVGEAFIEVSEEYANQYCESKQQVLSSLFCHSFEAFIHLISENQGAFREL